MKFTIFSSRLDAVSNVKTLPSSKLDVDRQTDYCNPRACALKVNQSEVSSHSLS